MECQDNMVFEPNVYSKCIVCKNYDKCLELEERPELVSVLPMLERKKDREKDKN